MKTLEEFVNNNFDGSYLDLYKMIHKEMLSNEPANSIRYNYHGDEVIFNRHDLKSKCFDELLKIVANDCDREMYDSYQPIDVLYDTRKKLKGLLP